MLLFQRVCKSAGSARPYCWKQKTHRLPAWGVLGSDNRWDRFSLLTLLFSGVFARLKHRSEEKFRACSFFFCSTKLITLRDLVGDRRWPGSHELSEARILPQ